MVFNFETGADLDSDFSSSETDSDDELETVQDDHCIAQQNEEPIPSSTTRASPPKVAAAQKRKAPQPKRRTPAIKKEVVRQILEEHLRQCDAARMNGVTEASISQWVRKYRSTYKDVTVADKVCVRNRQARYPAINSAIVDYLNKIVSAYHVTGLGTAWFDIRGMGLMILDCFSLRVFLE
jgi:predicted transcriptional regulator